MTCNIHTVVEDISEREKTLRGHKIIFKAAKTKKHGGVSIRHYTVTQLFSKNGTRFVFSLTLLCSTTNLQLQYTILGGWTTRFNQQGHNISNRRL
jgi:hypothetical protein